MHDKITDTDVIPPPGLLTIGRYGQVATDRRRWRPVVEAQQDWPGAQTPAASAVPNSAFLAHIIRMARELAEDERKLGSWLGLSPLLGNEEVRSTLRPHPIEKALSSSFGHLASVCRRPHQRLRTAHQLMPVSMVRKISSRTISHLAQHSEIWAVRQRNGVLPSRLLGQITVADTDLIENRVVAHLLDELWMYAADRLAALDRIDVMLDDVRRFLDDARDGARSWRTRNHAYQQIELLVREDHLETAIKRARDDATELHRSLSLLLRGELRTLITHPTNPGLRVPPTNLFVNDPHYRHCAQLWQVWAENRHVRSQDERRQELRDWCAGFDALVTLLVVQGLAQLGLVPLASARIPRSGEVAELFEHRGARFALAVGPDGAITLLRDQVAVLRIVPVPHCLTAGKDVNEIRRALDAISSDQTTANRAGREKGRATVPVAVVYPGARSERVALPTELQEAAHRYRSPASTGVQAMVPVSPLEVDSVSRVARAVRWAVDYDRIANYPILISVHRSESTELVTQFPWLRVSGDSVTAYRVPQADRDTHISADITAALTRANDNRRNMVDGSRVAPLSEALRQAATSLRALTECPVCGKVASRPERTLTSHDNDTYHCVCEHCGGSWGTRLCANCGHFPVLTLAEKYESTGGPEHDQEKRFSYYLLAAPCWFRARVFICPTCGFCDMSTKANCVRCAKQR